VGPLLLLFIAVPVVELVLLIEIGERIGPLATIGLVIGTGIVGASLARQQGLNTLGRLRRDLDAGGLPAVPIVEGVLILVAAAVLITPGVLTDLFGFFCLIPALRRLLARSLMRRFTRAFQQGTADVTMDFGHQNNPSDGQPMKNVTPPRPDVSDR